MIRTQSSPEEDEQGEGGRDVEADEEGEEARLARRLALDQVVPAEQGRQQHGVAEAGDGEQLGDALDEADDDGPKERQVDVGHRGGDGHGTSQGTAARPSTMPDAPPRAGPRALRCR